MGTIIKFPTKDIIREENTQVMKSTDKALYDNVVEDEMIDTKIEELVQETYAMNTLLLDLLLYSRYTNVMTDDAVKNIFESVIAEVLRSFITETGYDIHSLVSKLEEF